MYEQLSLELIRNVAPGRAVEKASDKTLWVEKQLKAETIDELTLSLVFSILPGVERTEKPTTTFRLGNAVHLYTDQLEELYASVYSGPKFVWEVKEPRRTGTREIESRQFHKLLKHKMGLVKFVG